jgi:hypothetical protein
MLLRLCLDLGFEVVLLFVTPRFHASRWWLQDLASYFGASGYRHGFVEYDRDQGGSSLATNYHTSIEEVVLTNASDDLHNSEADDQPNTSAYLGSWSAELSSIPAVLCKVNDVFNDKRHHHLRHIVNESCHSAKDKLELQGLEQGSQQGVFLALGLLFLKGLLQIRSQFVGTSTRIDQPNIVSLQRPPVAQLHQIPSQYRK